MIDFFFLTEAFDLPTGLLRRSFITHIAGAGYRTGAVSFIYVSASELLRINRTYLHHDYHTDVITFDDTVEDCLSADIYVGVTQVQENAVSGGHTFFSEMLRVMIHGVLHCMGYEDKTISSRAIMRAKEDVFIGEVRSKILKRHPSFYG